MQLTNIHSGQHPLLFHISGDWRTDIFRAIFDRAKKSIVGCNGRHPDLTVGTWNDGNPKCKKLLGAFEESCGWWQQEPLVMMSQAKQGTPAQFLRKRTYHTIQALRELRTEYVLFSDSGDSFLLGPPSEILYSFKNHFTADLVFLAGKNPTWPPVPSFHNFEKTIPWTAVAAGQQGLCDGTYIGRRKFCIEFFEAVIAAPPVEGYEFSAMAQAKSVWPQFYPQVTVDHLSIMFQIWNEDLVEIKWN